MCVRRAEKRYMKEFALYKISFTRNKSFVFRYKFSTKPTTAYYLSTSYMQMSSVRDLVEGVVRDGRPRMCPPRARRRRAHARAQKQQRLTNSHRYPTPERSDARWNWKRDNTTLVYFEEPIYQLCNTETVIVTQKIRRPM